MKVLCFGRFYDEIPGGMQRHIEHLFRALKGDVEFVHLVPSRDWSGAQFDLESFPVFRTPSFNVDGSLALSPRLISTALQLHRKHKFDLIHLHFPDPMSHLASAFIPASIPRVISWHADIIRQKMLLNVYRPFLVGALKKAAATIVATPFHIENSGVLSSSEIKKIHTIPMGFDLDRFAFPSPGVEEIKRKFPGRIIFALGRHVYYKGFDVLIRAMQHVIPGTKLLIGGTGPLTSEWKRLSMELGLADRVEFLGMVDEIDLPAYYQACDVFCLPAVSAAEAFGIVQVEAMAAGRPVVSTSVPSGVSFVNRHNESGLIVPPNDVRGLAAALNLLLSDADLRGRLGNQARELAFREFSLEAMGRRTLDVYKGVLG